MHNLHNFTNLNSLVTPWCHLHKNFELPTTNPARVIYDFHIPSWCSSIAHDQVQYSNKKRPIPMSLLHYVSSSLFQSTFLKGEKSPSITRTSTWLRVGDVWGPFGYYCFYLLQLCWLGSHHHQESCYICKLEGKASCWNIIASLIVASLHGVWMKETWWRSVTIIS